MSHTLQLRLGYGLIVITLLGGALYYYLNERDNHHNDEVHVHADWLVVIKGEIIDLTADKYQSTAEHVYHDSFHLHDHEDHVLHRHAEDITLGDFMSSIGFSLTNTCLTTDENETYCDEPENALRLYVNGRPYTSPPNYVIQEEDQVLIYYGERSQRVLESFLEQITDESCIYSGTCPERGIAPPESCGLTCEL